MATKTKKSPLAALGNEDIALLKQIFGDTLDLDDDLAVRSAVGDSVTSEQIRLVADDLLGPGAEAIPTGEAALGPEDQLRLALAREEVPGPAPAPVEPTRPGAIGGLERSARATAGGIGRGLQGAGRGIEEAFGAIGGLLPSRGGGQQIAQPNLASSFGPRQAQAGPTQPRPTQEPRPRAGLGPRQTQLGPTFEPRNRTIPAEAIPNRPELFSGRGSGLSQAVGQSGLPDTLSFGGPLPSNQPASEARATADGGSNTLANILKFGGVAALGALLANRSGGKGDRRAAPAGRGKFGSLERGRSLTVPKEKTGTERLFSALPAATNAFMNVRLQQQAREDALGQATAKAEAAQAKQRVDLGSLLIKEGLGKDGLNLIATVDPTILDTIDINNLPETGTLNTSDRLLSPEVFKNLTSEAKAAALTQFAEEKGINLPLGNLIRDDDNALSDSFLFKLAEMGIVLDTNSAVPREAFEQIAEFTAAQRRTESTQQRITNLKNTIGAINTATLIDTNFEDDGKAMIAQLTEELANLTGELTGGTQQVPAPDTSTPEGQQEIAAEIRNRRDQFKDMTPEELELALQNSKIDTSSPTIQEAIREVTGG